MSDESVLGSAKVAQRDFPATRQLKYVDQMIEARKYAMSGDFEQASQVYQLLTQAFPERYEPYHHLGVIADCQGRFPEAIRLYNESIRRRSTDAEVHFDFAQCYIEQGYFSEAEKHLVSAIQLVPSEVTFRESLGIVLAEQGRVKESVEQLSCAMDGADAWYHVSTILEKQGDVKRINECLAHAIELNPGHRLSVMKLQSLAGNEFVRGESLPTFAGSGSPTYGLQPVAGQPPVNQQAPYQLRHDSLQELRPNRYSSPPNSMAVNESGSRIESAELAPTAPRDTSPRTATAPPVYRTSPESMRRY